MKHLDAMRWSLWGMAAFGLGDTRGGTGGERGDSKSNSGGRSSSPGAGSKSGGASSGSTSSGRSSNASSSSSAGRGTSSKSTASSSSRSAGTSSGGGFGGGEGGEGRSKGSSVGSRSSAGTSSTAGSAARGASTGSVGAGASGGSMGPPTSRGAASGAASTGRQTGGTVGGGLAGAAGLTGSGLADKGGRVTGGFDSGRFGDTPAAEKGGRVTGADPGRFGSRASVGRQSSVAGSFANGGVSSDRAGVAARAGTATVGNGLASGISAPARSARAAETQSMSALNASRTVPSSNPRAAEDASLSALAATRPSSPDYGAGFAKSARAVEDQSMARQRAWDGFLGTAKSAEAQKAVNPATGKADPYNGLVGAKRGATAPTHADLTGMTISEVQNYQRDMVSRGHLSTAVGAYQMLDGTLSEATKRAGFDPATTKFTRSTQDQLARTLADDVRAAQASRSQTGLTPESLAAELSKEWAGFAAPNGKSHYAQDGVNKATVGYDRVLGAAEGLVASGAVGNAKASRVAGAKADRFGKQYLSASAAIEGVAPADTPKRATGLAAVSPTFGRFDKTGLSESVISVANAVGAAVPGASVISGYRSPERNAKVGGAKKSQHMQGQAVDIDMRGWTDDERRAALSAAVQAGAQGIGIYNNGTSLHVDTRPGSKAMWGGNPAGQYKGMSLAQAPSWSRDILSGWQGEPTKGARVTAGATPAPDLPAPRNVADRPVASVDRFADKYLGPASVPTPTARPDYTPARSTADKVLAGAIDLGVGLIPGVGLAAGIYSAAAPLVGLPSIGEMALTARDRNQFNVSADARKQGNGSRGDRDVEDRLRGAAPLAPEATAPVEPETPVPVAASERFEEKYLAFSDPTPRLTPGEKWGGSGANDVRYAL